MNSHKTIISLIYERSFFDNYRGSEKLRNEKISLSNKLCNYFRLESNDNETGICEASHNRQNVVNKNVNCYDFQNCPVYQIYMKKMEINK